MFTIGKSLENCLNTAIDYVVKNLEHQFVIPHYSCEHAWDTHNDIVGHVSKLSCDIEVKNIARYDEEATDDDEYGDAAIACMAQVIVNNYVCSDCDNPTFDCDEPIYHFKINYSKSMSRIVNINGEEFEITVIFERTYKSIEELYY